MKPRVSSSPPSPPKPPATDPNSRSVRRKRRDYDHRLSLCGPDSHVIRIEPGAGNCYVGPEKQRRSVPQALVDPGATPDWSAFEALDTGGAYAWPRYLYYEGNDPGVFEWAAKRQIERLTWTPLAPITVDASAAKIGTLSICLDQSELRIHLPSSLRQLSVLGRPEKLHPADSQAGASLRLHFSGFLSGSNVAFYPSLDKLLRLSTFTSQFPSDGKLIARYLALRQLSVHGGLANANVLRVLSKLESMAFRECWDLESLSRLSSWPNLRSLFAANIGAADASRMMAEANGLPELDATIRKARSLEWITANANSPFKNWTKSIRIAASAAYTAAQAEIAALSEELNETSVKQIVERFTQSLNAIHAKSGLETSEREDSVFAVWKLASSTPFAEPAIEWFDRERRF